MSETKLKFIIEVLFVVIGLIILTITTTVPDIKKQFGGSGKIINTKNYKNMVELNIDDKIDFIMVLDNDSIYHIFFLDNNSLYLYDKDIENNKINKSINIIVKILIENNLLKKTSQITLTKYNNYKYNEIKKELLNNLKKYSINNNIIETNSSMAKLKERYNLSSSKESQLLLELDLYSKNKVINNKEKENNDIIVKEDINPNKQANNVYKKIEKYIYENNISNLEKDKTILLIDQIPSDANGTIFPTKNSWYYVNDGKLYAYIELLINEKNYKYCYEGSIDIVKEGEC